MPENNGNNIPRWAWQVGLSVVAVMLGIMGWQISARIEKLEEQSLYQQRTVNPQTMAAIENNRHDISVINTDIKNLDRDNTRSLRRDILIFQQITDMWQYSGFHDMVSKNKKMTNEFLTEDYKK